MKSIFSFLLMPFCFVLGCGNAPRWDDLEQDIQEKFPEVQQLAIEDFRELDSGSTLLVDVRAKEEFDISHLKDAVLETDEEKLLELIQERRPVKVVLYCSVGYRSSAMAQRLQKRGHGEVYNLKGSIFQWANAGLPVWKDGKVTPFVHPYNENWGTLLDSRYHANANPKK